MEFGMNMEWYLLNSEGIEGKRRVWGCRVVKGGGGNQWTLRDIRWFFADRFEWKWMVFAKVSIRIYTDFFNEIDGNSPIDICCVICMFDNPSCLFRMSCDKQKTF